ncbi:MAG: helix-turn-helix transcriptional regulator [Clostridia bacterium]|nr:helix-turn-helix transcriptional regulator [Clostridia bacterium]
MSNLSFYSDFKFFRNRIPHTRTTDYTKGNGAPSHYIAKLTSGTGKIISDDTVLELNEGDICYIPKNLNYISYWGFETPKEVIFYSIGFEALPVTDKEFVLQKLEIESDAEKHLDIILNDMTVNCTTVGALYSFLGAVIPKMQVEKAKSNKYEYITKRALAFLDKNYTCKIDELAAFCGVSESGLYLIFQKVFNKTPLEIKHQIVCEKAKELLKTTTLSVEEISNMLHFSSSSYFRKIFRQQTGKNPLSIRKQDNEL